MPNLKFLALTVPEIWMGSQILKSRSSDPSPTPLIQFCIFSLVPLLVNMHAHFKVSSFNCTQDMEGVPKL